VCDLSIQYLSYCIGINILVARAVLRKSTLYSTVELNEINRVRNVVGGLSSSVALSALVALRSSTKYNGSNPNRATVGSSGHATGVP
jgi:hypothetical protein